MILKYAEIFCWKNVSSFCSAKATHIFSAKNIRILYIESAKTVNKMTLNELIKLTTLWTTGPRSANRSSTWMLILWRNKQSYPRIIITQYSLTSEEGAVQWIYSLNKQTYHDLQFSHLSKYSRYSKRPKILNTLFHFFWSKFCFLCNHFLKYLVEWQPV